MPVEPFSAHDRDYIIARNLRVSTAGGRVLTVDKVEIALVPVGRRPVEQTVWHETVDTEDGPGLLIAGGLANSTDAVVLTQSVDAYARYTMGDIVVIDELGRVPYRP